MYQIMFNAITGQSDTVKRLSDNAYIPFDTANRDYEMYLQWLAEGNQPLPADNPQRSEA
jgi:hypothetical protein